MGYRTSKDSCNSVIDDFLDKITTISENTNISENIIVYDHDEVKEQIAEYHYIGEKRDESYTFNNVRVKFINKSSKGAGLYAFKIDDSDIVKDTIF